MSDDKPTEQTGKKTIPPYLPFKTLKAFVAGLKVAMPSRIDRSLMPSMSGTMQSQLEGALKFLRLIDANGVPSEKFHALVGAEGEAYQKILRNILHEGYPFLFGDNLDLQKATPKELDEKFQKAGAGGDTIRKVVAFFLAATKEAVIPVSIHIAKRTKRGPTGARKARRSSAKKGPQHTSPAFDPPATNREQLTEFQRALLATIPKWDPDWPPETKKSYFDFLRELHQTDRGEGGSK